MIFVTVGTHEQQFNRLIKKIDQLKKEDIIKERVIIQTGFSTYKPQYCESKKLFPYKDMIKFIQEADIVITHGGPSSFVMPLQMGKVPIVVPRRKDYDEHVNDHQVNFCHEVENKQKNIIVVDDIEKLQYYIENYSKIIVDMSAGLKSNNEVFCEKFEEIVKELCKK